LLNPLQIGDYSACNANDVSWRRTEVVVPRSRSCPHFVELQQVRVNEHAQLSAVTERRNAKFGLSNPMRNTSMFLSEAIERTTV